ncbi:MAG: glycoside hydrolase family 3 protein [Actinomycetota bacterium]
MTGPAASIEHLITEMTPAEKIGQMAQVEKGSITPEEVAELGIGSVLSGGGGNPTPNDAANWAAMVGEMTEAAGASRLGIPLLYGVDGVHGHNNLRGATIFPHSIGLGATGDPDLVRRVARATAIEIAATGVRWDFAPCVAVPLDPRWGRTYEGFGRDPALVAAMGAAYVEGLHGRPGGPDPDDSSSVLACPKHYLGDGAAAWGSARRVPWNDWWDLWPDWYIDQGDAPIGEEELRAVHLHPYRAAVAAGSLTVMASYSSWRGDKMHGHRYLLEDVLRGELGFGGLVVSDWMGIDQLDPDYRTCVVRSVNAGVDMVMVPIEYRRFFADATAAVADGDISMERIDLAVRRILTAKAALGLLDIAKPDPPPLSLVGSAAHRALAREAVRRSVVLLRGEEAVPVPAAASVLVGGDGADDIGLQCGGWTIEWQGARGAITPGTTLLEALRASHRGPVHFLGDGVPESHCDVGILVASEEPYAEGMGDRPDLTLAIDPSRFHQMRSACERLIVVVYSGRPMLLPPIADRADAIVAAWLPGTEAGGVADVLLGRHPFEGRLPHPWP